MVVPTEAMRWVVGPDTGISSETIWKKFLGLPLGMRQSPPLDPSDFGRCHRLLHAVPGWRARIGEMATVRSWAGLVEAWDELEALYLEEEPSGEGPKLWRRMQQIEDEEVREAEWLRRDAKEAAERGAV
jgi:hypothetical protein